MPASTRVRRRSRLALIAFGAAALALLIAPAHGMAVFKFGSKLDPSVQPSNASPPHACDEDNPGAVCTWVMNEAYGRPDGGHKAPRRGVIRRIRLIAGAAGSFRLFTVRAFRDGPVYKGKALRRGPVINYQGQPPDVEDTYRVEVFKVRIRIRRGVRLAIRTSQTSTLRCSSGGPNTLLFQPPLFLTQPFRPATGDDGCWLLLEAVAVRPPRRRR
jgi:hypothetical protein